MNNEDTAVKAELEDKAPGEFLLPIPIEHIKTEKESKDVILRTAEEPNTDHYFRCPFYGCPFTTNTLKLYKEHKKRHIFKGCKKCLYCSFSSNKQSTLTWHLLQHVEAQNTKPTHISKVENMETVLYCSFPCCPFTTRNYLSFKSHQSKHTSSRFKCYYCLFKCRSKNALKAHLKRHERLDGSTPSEQKPMELDDDKNDASKPGISQVKRGKHDFLRQFLKYDKWSMRIYLQCPKCPFKKKCSKNSNFIGHLQRHSTAATGTKCAFCTYKGSVKGIKIHELIHLDRKVRLKRDWCNIVKNKLYLNPLEERNNYKRHSNLLTKESEEIPVKTKKAQITTSENSMTVSTDNNVNSERLDSSSDIPEMAVEQQLLNRTINEQDVNAIPELDTPRCEETDIYEAGLNNNETEPEPNISNDESTTSNADDLSNNKEDDNEGYSVANDDSCNQNGIESRESNSNNNNKSITITITTSQTCNNADLIKQVLVNEILKKFESGHPSEAISGGNENDPTEEFCETTEICATNIEASPVHNESLFSNEFEMFVDCSQDNQSETDGFIEVNRQSDSEENCLEELISNDCLSLFEVSTGADRISSLEDENSWNINRFAGNVHSSIDLPEASDAMLTTKSTGFKESDEVIIIFDSDEENQSENRKKQKREPKRKLAVEKRVRPTNLATLTKQTPSTNKEIYKCTQCPSQFSVKSQLAIHNMLHIAGAGLKCPLCSYTNNKTSLLNHLLCHVISDEGLYKCPLCDTTKRNIEYMNDHFKVVHSSHIFQPHEAVCRRRFCSGSCGKFVAHKSAVNTQEISALPLNCIDFC